MWLINQRSRLNRAFVRVQIVLLTAYLASSGLGSLAGYFGRKDRGGPIANLLHYLYCYGLAWAVLATLLVVVHVLVARPLRPFIYYRVWLQGMVPRLQAVVDRRQPGAMARLAKRLLGRIPPNMYRVMKSVDPSGWNTMDRSVPYPLWDYPLPVFVRRQDLGRSRFWPDWAFSIIVLFNRIVIKRIQAGRDPLFRLEVDLRDQSFGIYNHWGKRFMMSEWGNDSSFDRTCEEWSDQVSQMLGSRSKRQDPLVLDCERLPMRWASGGFLPIVRWKQKQKPKERWFAFFFRDINPVGWNVANGASESKREYKDLRFLIAREFAEELVVLNSPPGHGCSSLPFDFPDDEMNNAMQPLAKEHLSHRRFYDGIAIEVDQKRKTELSELPTPFSVRIDYHSPSLADRHSTVDNVLFQVNPYEFGIEVLKVCEFDVPEQGYLLDGEIWVWRGVHMLVRRPIILLRVEYLRSLFKQGGGSLGPTVTERPHLECKRIGPPIPQGEFHLFDADVGLRERRLQLLEGKQGAAADIERRCLTDWLKGVGDKFRNVGETGQVTEGNAPELLYLCPASWKAVEQVFRHGVL